MDITSAILDLNFSARSRATQQGLTGSANIGKRIAETFEADIAYSFKAVAAANANVATLTHATALVAQTTGSPVITDGDGNDWEGVDLPAATTSLIYLVAVKAGAGNTGTVTLAAADGAEAPAGILKADGLILLSQPNAAAVGSGSTLGLTFSAAGDTAEVWVFAKATA